MQNTVDSLSLGKLHTENCNALACDTTILQW